MLRSSLSILACRRSTSSLLFSEYKSDDDNYDDDGDDDDDGDYDNFYFYDVYYDDDISIFDKLQCMQLFSLFFFFF